MSRFLDPTLDVVFTLLLGSPETKDCLISLLSAVLHPRTPILDIEVLNPGPPKESVDDKGIVLDLLVRLADGSVVDVEMQVERRAGFRKRALYYWARAFAAQLVRGQEYVRLRPAVLVVFLCYEELAALRLHSVFQVLETHDHELFGEELSVHLIELPKLGRMPAEEQAAELRLVRWARFFTAETDEEFEEAAKGDEMVGKATDYLEQLSARADVRLLAERREMGHLMYRMELTEARIESRAEGKAEGEAKGRRETLLALLEKRFGPLTDEQRHRAEAADPDLVLDRLLTAESLADLLGS